MNKADQAVTINNCLTKSENGIILVNKPQGVTSNEVVQTIRKNIGIKIGHCGTLDPLATGLLIACVGKGTKISNYIMSLEKEYLALIQLGEERDTDDEMGITIEKSDVQVTEKQIHDVLMQFEGDINQMPPQFSAIKVNGKRAYSVARKGETVSLTSRNVKIYDYQLISFQNQQITLRVVCSRGTYIRSLARDIGRKLG
ncbi:MAG: tRNA pseudouridine(55) synthase TruB, partial [Spirochaetota bacterium]|nr:tRNA pseudouridine(55) synthase TruB [Spirochaetota bacterium]